ncbi:MAG: LCP family protein, partial [Clostridia bacterium]|nr:LCP family protein [Clostridia bacterium]
MSGIVNVALFGIDAREDDSTTSGTMPHTDVNMVVAVNFDTKEVSLISLARDVFTSVPGHSGFYKFNGIFNVGGGMADPKAGFELSSRALEEWLGGVSVPYYYGLDFQAVIDLVDAIGGIDFDLDITLYSLDKRTLATPGRQHLDGERVLAYLRMRKTAGALDYKRTARQRKMMVALFQKLKESGNLSLVPDLLKTMGDNLYTNTTLE